MNWLAKAADYLQSRMEAETSEDVAYVRNGMIYKLPAIVGQLITETTDVNGFVVRQLTRDFTIRQTALQKYLPDGPQRNDQIWQTINGRRHVFIVNADSFATSHYEESDGYGVAWRIHTRRDSIDAA